VEELIFIHENAADDLPEPQRYLGYHFVGCGNFPPRIYRSAKHYQNVYIRARFSLTPGMGSIKKNFDKPLALEGSKGGADFRQNGFHSWNGDFLIIHGGLPSP
jgi:hypothetical protein